MTKVVTAEQLTPEELRIPKEGVPILALYYLPKTGAFAFLGYQALTELLKNGVNVEQYLTTKLSTARRVLIKTN